MNSQIAHITIPPLFKSQIILFKIKKNINLLSPCINVNIITFHVETILLLKNCWYAVHDKNGSKMCDLLLIIET